MRNVGNKCSVMLVKRPDDMLDLYLKLCHFNLQKLSQAAFEIITVKFSMQKKMSENALFIVLFGIAIYSLRCIFVVEPISHSDGFSVQTVAASLRPGITPQPI